MNGFLKLGLIVRSLILLFCLLAVGVFDSAVAEAGCGSASIRHRQRSRLHLVHTSYVSRPSVMQFCAPAAVAPSVNVTVSSNPPVEVASPSSSPCGTTAYSNGQCGTQGTQGSQRTRIRIFQSN